MTQKDHILKELKELESMLANHSISNSYQVPVGYFEDLAGVILSRIRTLEAADSREELELLSPLLAGIDKKMHYGIPESYFQDLETRLSAITGSEQEYEDPTEELESLSPLLSGLKKQTPYSIPDNYFETLQPSPNKMPVMKKGGKVISLTSHKWFRYAAAAIVVGFVALAALLVFDKPQDLTPEERFAKNMKNVSTEALDEFIDLAAGETPLVASNESSSAEVRELVKNISDESIQDFLNDIEASVPNLNEELLLN